MPATTDTLPHTQPAGKEAKRQLPRKEAGIFMAELPAMFFARLPLCPFASGVVEGWNYVCSPSAVIDVIFQTPSNSRQAAAATMS